MKTVSPMIMLMLLTGGFITTEGSAWANSEAPVCSEQKNERKPTRVTAPQRFTPVIRTPQAPPPPPRVHTVTKKETRYVPTQTTPSAHSHSSAEKNVIMIDQRKTVLANRGPSAATVAARARHVISNEQQKTKNARRVAKEQNRRANHYKRLYEDARKNTEKTEQKTPGLSGFYLGLVGGVSRDRLELSNDNNPDYTVIESKRKPFVGLRVMGITESGVAAGLQVTTDSSISFDVNFRIR